MLAVGGFDAEDLDVACGVCMVYGTGRTGFCINAGRLFQINLLSIYESRPFLSANCDKVRSPESPKAMELNDKTMTLVYMLDAPLPCLL